MSLKDEFPELADRRIAHTEWRNVAWELEKKYDPFWKKKFLPDWEIWEEDGRMEHDLPYHMFGEDDVREYTVSNQRLKEEFDMKQTVSPNEAPYGGLEDFEYFIKWENIEASYGDGIAIMAGDKMVPVTRLNKDGIWFVYELPEDGDVEFTIYSCGTDTTWIEKEENVVRERKLRDAIEKWFPNLGKKYPGGYCGTPPEQREIREKMKETGKSRIELFMDELGLDGVSGDDD